jgi:uncharacterized protein YceK
MLVQPSLSFFYLDKIQIICSGTAGLITRLSEGEGYEKDNRSTAQREKEREKGGTTRRRDEEEDMGRSRVQERGREREGMQML